MRPRIEGRCGYCFNPLSAGHLCGDAVLEGRAGSSVPGLHDPELRAKQKTRPVALSQLTDVQLADLVERETHRLIAELDKADHDCVCVMRKCDALRAENTRLRDVLMTAPMPSVAESLPPVYAGWYERSRKVLL